MKNRAARRRATAAAGRTKDASREKPAAAVEPEALVVSHCFDSGEDGEPYSATIRLTGRRAGVHGIRTSQDDFVQEQKIEGVVPGSGPVSVTTWVYGLHPGEWTVNAELPGPPRS